MAAIAQRRRGLRYDRPMMDVSQAADGLRRGATVMLDLLLPPQCLNCRAAVDRQGELCADCWQAIRFLAEPCCARCGYPFDYDEGVDALCAACLGAPPDYDRARAVMAYDDASRHLLLSFKHGDRLEGAPSYGRWLERAGRPLLETADLIVPVPLHRWRLLKRRYNQAALLAQALARRTGLPAVNDLLRRKRATPSQGGLSAAGRRANVRGAFAVRPAYADRLAGRRVLLVDDVMTTGATVNAVATVLRRHGVLGVDVLTLARVVRPLATA